MRKKTTKRFVAGRSKKAGSGAGYISSLSGKTRPRTGDFGSGAVTIDLTPYPKPDRSLAGKWVAWSRRGQLIASGETLSEVVRAASGHSGVSYERLPKPDRIRVR